MECGDTPHFVISHMDAGMDMDREYGSIDMDIDIEYGSTSKLGNIHMDKDMDMDMEYGST